ncbi:signal peptidase I [Anaerolineae bacterium CFX7]|nr:signal peptidase I [Anaerolineae bacterium CFX7]
MSPERQRLPARFESVIIDARWQNEKTCQAVRRSFNLEPANRYEFEPTSPVNSYPLADGAPMPEVSAVPAKSNWGNATRELVETVLLTLVIFFMIRFAVENYRIEGYSMEPNFHDGQFLLVSRLNYLLGPPERGDVVIFQYPLNPKKNFIKRVIGKPGETVQIKAGKIFVNGVRVPEPYPYNFANYDWGPVTIGPDEYFVLGDNRPESSDSHAWGMLPAKNIIGKAWVSYWPPDEWGIIKDYTYAAK